MPIRTWWILAILVTGSSLCGQVSLLKDIRPGSTETSSDVTRVVQSGGQVFFLAQSPFAGNELWVTDGTTAGTKMVIDFAPGVNNAQIGAMAAFNGGLLFSGNDGLHGHELWFTDGTAAGTVLVKDILNGVGSSNPSKFCVTGGIAFFVATDGSTGQELWRTDGTTAGTQLVRDINPGSAGSSIDWLTPFGADVLFAASNGTQGVELWKSDGTNAGTVLVLDINTGAGSSNPSTLCVAGGRVFFGATTSTEGMELWVSDGSAAGTTLVADIQTGTGSGAPWDIVELGTNVVFSATTPATGREPWFSDGTAAGTIALADIYAGSSNSMPLGTNILSLGTTVVFAANNPSAGTELWRTDGTVGGTYMLADLATGASSGNPQHLTRRGTQCFFWSNNSTAGGSGLHSTDGTTAGTSYVAQALIDTISGAAMVVLGTNLVFAGTVGASTDLEINISDGTTAGTQLLKNINSNPAGSMPSMFVAFGAGYLFKATTQAEGEELWFTDGTASGTQLVRDIRPGVVGSNIMSLMTIGSVAVFRADDGTHGLELWVTDGTTAGTQLVLDINTGSANGVTTTPVLLGSSVIFAATDPANGQEVWISDGTSAGTSIVRDIRPGSAGSSPAGLAVVGNRVYFSANDGTNGSEPWFTDGTTGGTQMLRDIRTGGLASSSPSSFTAFGSNVLFVADDGTNGFELWFSDGTTGGTILLKDIYPGTTPSSISSITVSGGLAFFRATSPSEGSELWRTNGTPAGTVLVADIFSGGNGSDPSLLFPYNNGILFSATDGSSGRELWFSDGTTGGTLQVADTNAGAASGQPAWLAEIGGQVLFFSTSASEGRELWKTNGTVGGTQLVKDIYPGRYDSLYTSGEMRVVGGYAYFFALDKTESLALWRSDGTAAGTTMAAAGVDGAAPVGTGFTIPFGTQLLVIMGTPEYGQELWLLTPGSTNVPPTVNLSATTWTYTENDPATLVDPGATVTDPDSADFDGGVLTVAYLSGQNSANRLRVRNIGTGAGQIGISGNNVSFGGVVIGTVSGGTGTSNLLLAFNASSSPAAAQAALRAIEFEIQSDDPGAASRVLSITLSDGDGGTSAAVQLTIAVVPVNDPTTMIVPTTPTSGFTGPAGGPFTLTLGSASASVTTAHLQLVDPDNLMSITSVTVSTPAPGSLSGPPLQSGLTSGAILSWTGPAANTLPGSYTWTVDVSDGQGNTFTFLATIVVPNDVPTFQYGTAVSAGTGTVAQPYLANAVLGAQPTLHIATVLDTCQAQTLQMTSVTPDAGNPSNVFNFSMTAGPFPRTLNALAMSVLAASDVGAHRFAVDVTDGLVTVTLHVRIDVASSGNQPPAVVPAAGSQFAGTVAAGFLLQVDAGSTVTGIGTLAVSDPEGDPITILSVTIAPYAPNTVLGPTAPGPGLSGFTISFNGQMNVAETPGDYVWTITLRDAANNTVVFTATIRLRDAVPAHQIGPEALSGDGSSGTPYETSVVVGWFGPLQMFEIIDPNTSQTHSIVSVVPGAGNPTGGAGFAWSIPTPFSYVVADPPLPLNALDAGVHDFAVTISDGANNVTVHVRITVTNPGGGGGEGGGGDDGGGCAVAPQAGLSVLVCGLMLLVLVRRRRLCRTIR